MNQFPFLETTESCQGHPFYDGQFRRGRYSVGYVMGHGDGPKFKIFSERLEKFIEEYNKNRGTQFGLPWNGRSDFQNGFFWLGLYPRKRENLSESLMTNTLYLQVRNKAELMRIDREMASSWRELYNFLNSYRH